MERVGIVQPSGDGFAFNIQADGPPLRLMVVKFPTRQAAQSSRDKIYEALEDAISVSTAAPD